MFSRCLRTVPRTRRACGYLGVGVPGGHQAQQVPVPGSELRRAEAVLLGVQIGLMQRGEGHRCS
jgi:hypothetical protein